MESEERKIIQNTENMINSLKAICNSKGLGNSSGEYKIITQVFLYKFLNDKFLYEIKNTSEDLKKCNTVNEVEEKLQKLSDDEYKMLLIKLKPDTAKLKREHLISYLFNNKNDEKTPIHKLLDNTLIDIANYNIDIFSVKTGGEERIRLFDTISNYIIEVNKRDEFARAIIDKLVEFSFNDTFSQKYDFFATIFEYLIGDYNKDSGKYAEYYTPNVIARIIAKILVQDKVQNVDIYDPSAGSGTLLLALAHEIGEENCTLYTQDISQKSNEFLRLNLILNNLVHSLNNVIHGNTLTEPAHLNNSKNRLKEFDYIVSNPPFKTDFSDEREILASDKHKERFFAGVPKVPNKDKDKMSIYLMFIQHILYSLNNQTGKAAIVVPTGFLTAQSGIEKTIRESLVKEKSIIGVVSMPSNIFANTGTNVSIVFIDKGNKKDEVLLVDASNSGEKVKEGKNQKTVLRPNEVEQIINTFIQKQEIDDFSKIVTYEEMKNKNCSFSAGQYFDIKIEHIDITKEEFESKLQEHKNNLKSYFEESNRLEKEIFEQLSGLKYEE